MNLTEEKQTGDRGKGNDCIGATDGYYQALGLTEALKEVSLMVGPGVFGLLGSTARARRRCCACWFDAEPIEGRLRLLGRDPADREARWGNRRRLGYLPQSLGFYPDFTVFEFVEYFALLKEMAPEQVRPAVVRAIERVGLDDRARAQLKTLSGHAAAGRHAQAIVNDRRYYFWMSRRC